MCVNASIKRGRSPESLVFSWMVMMMLACCCCIIAPGAVSGTFHGRRHHALSSGPSLHGHPGYRVQPHGCAQPCHCNRRGVADCSGHGLTDWPNYAEFSPSIKVLVMAGNKLTDIPEGLFSHLTQLDVLNLVQNRISSLDNASFAGSNLTTLHLDYNRISRVDIDGFSGCESLRFLSLADNSLSLHELNGSIAPLRSLRELDMRSNNPIKGDRRIPEGFGQLYALETLKLGANHIEDIPADFFDAISGINLTNLDLMQISPVKSIDNSAFSKLQQLRVLDISFTLLTKNDLENLFNGLRNTSIHVLNISFTMTYKAENHGLTNNTFSKLHQTRLMQLDMRGSYGAFRDGHVPRGLFQGLRHLHVLHLSHCTLRKLGAKSFKGLRSLRRLHLQNNQLICSDINECAFLRDDAYRLEHLQLLDLSYNSISDDQHLMSFRHSVLPKLAVLNLKGNQLTVLRKRFLDSRLPLKQLILSENPLKTIKPGALTDLGRLIDLQLSTTRLSELKNYTFWRLKNLQHLNLSNAEFTSIEPKAFSRLHSLHNLDLSYNRLAFDKDAIFLQDAKKLLHLSLAHNEIRAFPPTLLPVSNSLRKLDLRQNKIRSWSRTTPFQYPNLTYLDISFNDLVHLSRDTFAMFPALRHLRINGNPTVCTCDTPGFREWADTRGIHVFDRSHLTCLEAPHYRETALMTYEAPGWTCYHKERIVYGALAAISAVLFFIVCVVGLRHCKRLSRLNGPKAQSFENEEGSSMPISREIPYEEEETAYLTDSSQDHDDTSASCCFGCLSLECCSSILDPADHIIEEQSPLVESPINVISSGEHAQTEDTAFGEQTGRDVRELSARASEVPDGACAQANGSVVVENAVKC